MATKAKAEELTAQETRQTAQETEQTAQETRQTAQETRQTAQETRQTAQETEQTAQETRQDPWKTKKSIFLPRGFAGQQKFVMVGVNGRRYQVPRGKTVEVPLPLYERLMIMLEGENKAAAFMENLPNETAPDMEVRRI